MVNNCAAECDALIDICTECREELCKGCIKEHCTDVCTARGLPTVCESCNIEEELHCVECCQSERYDKLGCDTCEVIDETCSECSDVKDCDYRR